MMTKIRRLYPAVLAALLAACNHYVNETPPPIPLVEGHPETAFALRYIDIARGTGRAAESGKCIFAHYTGWLTNGKKFDSSRDTTEDGKPRTPFGFLLGAKQVIVGWDAGFDGMQVGGRRRLFVPYQLAYGERGRPPIPPRAELIFDVELMAVTDTVQRAEGARAPACPKWEEVAS